MKNRNQIHIFIRLHLMFKKFTQALCEYNSTLFSAVRCKKTLKKRNLVPSFQKRNSSLFSFKNLHKTFHLSIYIYIYIEKTSTKTILTGYFGGGGR